MIVTAKLSEAVSFTCGLDGVYGLGPGKVIEIADNDRAAGAVYGGRLVSCTSNQATLDRTVFLEGGVTYTFKAMLPDGTIHEATITSAAGETDTVTFTPSISGALPVEKAVWVIEKAEIPTTKWRIVGIAEKSEVEFTISAVKYDEGKYAAVDQGILFDQEPYTQNPFTIQAPSGLQCTETKYSPAPGVEGRLVIASWNGILGAEHYIVEYSTDTETKTVTTTGTLVEIPVPLGGEISFRVRAVYPDGKRGPWSDYTYTTQGIDDPPPDVTSFSGTYLPASRQVKLAWGPVEDPSLSHYEIRMGDVPDWDSASVVVEQATGTSVLIPFTENLGGTRRYWIKAVDRFGVYSVNAAWTDVAINTSLSGLSVPQNIALSTGVRVAEDGNQYVWLRATWDDNAELDPDWVGYEIKLVKEITGFPTSVYATKDTQYFWDSVEPGVAYHVEVRAVDSGLARSAWGVSTTITAALDSDPPEQVTWPAQNYIVPGFKVMGLAWNAVADKDVAHYEVQRSETGSFAGEEVTAGTVKATYFADTQLDVDTTYYYRVRAVDTSGNQGPWSSVVSATTLKVGESDIAYNSVTAQHIKTFDLSVVSAVVSGTLTAGKLASPDWGANSGMLIDLENGTIQAGGSTDPKLHWNGTDLRIKGTLEVGSSVDWSAVTGTGKPEDNATWGAPYGTNIGDTPVETVLSNIQSALDTAAAAQAAADGAIATYYQATPPTSGMNEGDLWFDTANGNKPYRYSGSSWVAVQDRTAVNAFALAQTADAKADGKVTTYFSTSTPTAEAIGDLWYNSSTKILKRWNGRSWNNVANFVTRTSELIDNAGLGTRAVWARISGRGKPENGATNDSAWRHPYDITKIDGGKIYTRTITADKIASRTITADKIASRTITADKIAFGTITARELASRTITADKIASRTITARELSTKTLITTSAQVANAVITNAKIANAAVTTLKVAGNAITIPVGSYIASEWGNNQGTAVSVRVRFDYTTKVLIIASCAYRSKVSATRFIRFELRVGTTVLQSVTLEADRNYKQFCTSSIVSRVSPGTYTYSLYFSNVTDRTDMRVKNRSISVISLKR